MRFSEIAIVRRWEIPKTFKRNSSRDQVSRVLDILVEQPKLLSSDRVRDQSLFFTLQRTVRAIWELLGKCGEFIQCDAQLIDDVEGDALRTAHIQKRPCHSTKECPR